MVNEWIRKLDNSARAYMGALWQVVESTRQGEVVVDETTIPPASVSPSGRLAPRGLVAAVYLAAVAVWRLAAAALPLVERAASDARRDESPREESRADLLADLDTARRHHARRAVDEGLRDLRATLAPEEWARYLDALSLGLDLVVRPPSEDLSREELEDALRVSLAELLRRALPGGSPDTTGAFLALVALPGHVTDGTPEESREAAQETMARALVSALALEPLRHYAAREMLRRAAPADDDARARVTAAVETILR